MELKRSNTPFRFYTQSSLVELTGIKVRDLNELVATLKSAPGSVIYYHTHHFLKQHQFLSPEPANDFAYWVTNILLEEKLGEQLAAIDTVRFTSIKALREAIVETIEKFLAKTKTPRIAPEMEEFYFMKSKSFVLPTNHEANNLEEFLICVHKISIHCLYHHIFEARLRLERGGNDFSSWLENELGEKALAQAIDRLDPYTYPLEGLRAKIISLIENRLVQYGKEVEHAPR